MKDEKNKIMSVLRKEFGEIKSAFVLNWTPEQGEDIYTVLVNASNIVYLEISKENDSLISFSVNSVREYEKRLRGKPGRIQLAVALDISKTLSK